MMAPEPRLVVVYRPLNSIVQRLGYPFPDTSQIRKSLKSDSRCFFTSDFVSGYHQVPIDKEHQLATTFLVTFNKYCFKVLPQCLSDSQDLFNICSEEWSNNSMDNILGQRRSPQDVYDTAARVCSRVIDNGFFLSEDKLRVGTTLKYSSFVLNAESGVDV